MNVKAIVKVMNFHALLRVDRAHKEADRYKQLEQEVVRMIDIIQNNRNLMLDRCILLPPEDAPRLRIYIGSDLGFCGAVNASASAVLQREKPENVVIVIGKKVHGDHPFALNLARDEFESRYDEIEAFLRDAVQNRSYSGIDVIYDHYHNMTHIEPTEKTIFPIQMEDGVGEEAYDEDFYIEDNDAEILMEELMVTYLNYEMRSAAVNSFASENILRQNATNESMKRITEMEEEERWEEHKKKNALAAQRVIDSYTKTKYRAD